MTNRHAERKTMDAEFLTESFRHGKATLHTMNPAWADVLGQTLAEMSPWSVLGYSADTLRRYLQSGGAQRQVLAIIVDGNPAACLAIRPNWLRGDLLELLAVSPAHQGMGLGKAAIAYLDAKGKRQGQKNLWTIASAFNHAARQFYQAQGFVEAGWLPGLLVEGEAEILLRLRLDESVGPG